MGKWSDRIIGGVIGALLGLGAQIAFDPFYTDKSEQRIEELITQKTSAETQLASEQKRIDNLESQIVSLEQELDGERDVVIATQREIALVRNRAGELTSALDVLDILFASVSNCVGKDFGTFASFEQAFEALGEDTYSRLRCARRALNGFSVALETFRDRVAPSFNGRIQELTDREEVSEEQLFEELQGILAEQDQRRKQIIIALDELYAAISQ